MPKATRRGGSRREPTSVKRGGGKVPAPRAPASARESLAIQALQVLIAWNRHSVQAQNEALERRQSLEHVYALFWEYRGADGADAELRGVYATAKAANDAAPRRRHIAYDDPPGDATWSVMKQRLHGSVPSAAALDAATARALHVAAGAPRDAAAALLANGALRAGRMRDRLFAVMRHYAGYGEEGQQLRSVWRSKAQAEREARRLTVKDDDEKDTDDGDFGFGSEEYDYWTVQAVKLAA
ncbi:hypothetical protein JKP88DRAFT_242686 [Tribonema minus]|uniref:Uncharacterized protein n=1 Tax=Tribonema minus TaxID=303371 RepID=A0A836CND8_9STRA|nr:hypothetical protein JKP88DRAFT_242686 [Tribonema minus]